MKVKQTVARLWPYLAPYKYSIFFALLLSFPMAAINVLPAKLMQFLTDEVLVKKDYAALRTVAILIPVGFLANFIVRFSNGYLIRSSANRMIQKIRNDVVAHLAKLSVGYFNEMQAGAIVSRVINDVQTIVRAISGLVDLVKEPVTLLALLCYAFYLNWQLTLITLLLIPLAGLLLSNAGKHSKRYSNTILNKLGEMSSLLTEAIGGVRVVQSFNLESYVKGRFMKGNREFTRAALKAIRLEELSRPAVEFIFGLAMTFLIFYSGREIIKDRMTIGEFTAFIACFGMMLNPLKKILELNMALNQSAAAVENIYALLDVAPDIQNAPDAVALKDFQSNIEFRNLRFRYPKSDRDILQSFNLQIKKGEVIAFVGASGAGKSTILSLLPRFQDPQEGQVLLDGIDLRKLELASLRSKIALVSQDVFLFHDSLRVNIRAGCHSATDEDIKNAAIAAQAWNFIEALPNGLDTVIGDRGQKLSGGERQRISIARAVLKNAPILLLDEATSALDSENERLVQLALDRLMKGRTALVVAHRLSTIRKADRIIVMEKGKILEEGNHETLLSRGGAYAEAINIQSSFSD
ncbi:MAG: ABC transporter ATP-binding protein/permease [Oligoflexia bacterium]|nr:ABC transporter ATP-binding protein/permease [Oligoflexia bacterium]